MNKLSGIISLVLLAIIMVIVMLARKKLKKRYSSLGVYLISIFAYELTMLVTAIAGMNNHIIANLHSLYYLPITFWVLINVYKKIYRVEIPVLKLVFVLSTVVFTGWCIENFVVGTVFEFNSVVPVASSVLLTLIGIYNLNLLFFVKNTSPFKEPDVLIVLGILVRSVLFGFLLGLFNADFGFEEEFYSELIVRINIGLCISDLLFIMALYRITGMGKLMKSNKSGLMADK